jgi:hypothetical protein
MSLGDLSSREAVLEAIREFEQLGQEAFLEKYGFGPATEYLLRYEGKEYDSKAIAGVAHGFQFPLPGPLKSGEFSGGANTVAKKLQSLGFEVSGPQEEDSQHSGLKVGRDLGQFRRYAAVWVEITRLDHGHGGPGWEFGKCLWSPSRAKNGGDRYAIMRKPRAGDLVLHILHRDWDDGISETRTCGFSRVATQFKQLKEEPPEAGPWRGQSPYYRIDLTEFRAFPHPLPLGELYDKYGDDILAEIQKDGPKDYPFTTYGPGLRTAQGRYLASCTPRLFQVFKTALELEEVQGPESQGAKELEQDFLESKRLSHEKEYFARNPALARAAKEFHGYSCQGCGFNFLEVYGELGKNYIECHHLNQLSDRPAQDGETKTSVSEVRVLCSNCHRMIHRRRKKPLKLEELRECLESAKARTRPGFEAEQKG